MSLSDREAREHAPPRWWQSAPARVRILLSRRDVQLLVAITAGAAALRFSTLGFQSLWYDETVTASLVRQPFDEMMRLLPDSETAPPLYYAIAWIWVRVFGSSDDVLRSLSAVAGTLTVPVAYAAVKALVSRRAAFVVASLAAFSPLLVWYSQEARAYSLLLLLSAVSLLGFALIWRATNPTPRLVAFWSVSACLAVATYYYAAFFVLGEAALLLLRHRRRSTALGTGAIVLVGAALLPLAVVQARTGNASWIQDIPRTTRVEETIRQLVTPAPAPSWAGAGSAEQATDELWIVAALVLALALAVAVRFGGTRERQSAAIGFGLGAAMIVSALIVSVVGSLVFDNADTFLYRALLPAWMALALAIGAGFGARRAGTFGLAAAGALAGASLAVTIAIAVDSDLQRDDWRAVAAATEGAPAIVVSPAYQSGALLHYRADLEQTPPGGLSASRIDLVSRGSGSSESFELPSPFALVEERRIQYWVLRRFRSDVPVHLDVQTLSADPSRLADIALLGRTGGSEPVGSEPDETASRAQPGMRVVE